MTETLMEYLIEDVMQSLALKEPQTREAAQVLLEYLVVFDQKQHDYGPGNIARFGEQGILVRSSDKLERLINLADRGEDPSVSGEAVDDTWQDLMGYALIAQLVRRGMWLSGHVLPTVERAPLMDPSAVDPHYYQVDVVEFFKDDPMLGAAARDLAQHLEENSPGFHAKCYFGAGGEQIHLCRDRAQEAQDAELEYLGDWGNAGGSPEVLSPDGDHHEDDDCPRDHNG